MATPLVFEALWRDRGAKKGLKDLGDEADKSHNRLKRFTSQAGKDARSLGGVFGKLDKGAGAGLGNVTRGLGKMGGAAAKFAGGAALAFGAASAAAVGFGVKTVASNEQARISFTTMLGSAVKADKFLKQLQAFAAKTPFEFPELQTAASSLISAGINANKVIPIMTTLGNVTSGMGTGAEGVKRATIALQQMAAAGRITGEDLNQLRDAGIPVYDLLAKATGKSKAEVVKLAQAGKLGSKELGLMMKALESGKGLERFAGLMDKQSASLSGMWSTFKDVFGQGMAGVMQQFLPMMKAGLGDVSAGASRVFGWFNKNKDTIGSVFASASSILGSFGRIAKATLGAFVGSMSQSGASLKDFARFLETNQGAIVGGFVSFAKGAIQFGLTLAKVLSTGLRAFGGFADGVGAFVSGQIDFFGLFLRAATKAFGWMPGIGPKLKTLDANFEAFANNAHANMTKTGDGARGIADKIDKNMVPALTRAGRKIDEVGRKEIWTAKNRDAAARASHAIRDIGIKADGSQVKLKSWNERTRLGSVEQRALEGRIRAARQRMLEQRETAIRAGATQGELTKRWNQGREALFREFRQMELSNKAARDLANRYGQIPKKAETKVTQPGMAGETGALQRTKRLADRIHDIPNRRDVRINFSTNAAGVAGKFNVNFANSRELTARRAAGGPIQNVSGRGRRGVDTEPILAAVDEHVWTDKEVAAVGGHRAMYRMRKDALAGRLHGYAAGGTVTRNIVTRANMPNMATVPNAFGLIGDRIAAAVGKSLGTRISAALQSAIAAASTASYTSPGKFGRWSAEQMRNAATIASVGSGMGRRAQTIGIATAIVESGLRNLGFGDRDSVGLFQQRTPWGSRAARMNPRISAGMFFHGGRGGQRGLDDVPWQNLSIGRAAQAVQVSAFPGRYQTQANNAVRILNALRQTGGGGGAITGGQGITGPAGGMTTFHGGRLTQLAARNMRRAERIAGVAFRVFQGGWRPRTSYSGTSHAGDAIDTQASARVIRAIRAVGWASGDRTGLGNWTSHAHSVPGPSTGRARGSAVWQYQDYLRRGGARQSLRSPWGLERGGLLTARVAERGPERILSARQTNAFERMVSHMDRGSGGGTTVHNHYHFDKYIGSKDEIRQFMVEANRQNKLAVLNR